MMILFNDKFDLTCLARQRTDSGRIDRHRRKIEMNLQLRLPAC